MEEIKRMNLINELISLIPQKIYKGLIEEKVDWLNSIDVQVSLVSSRFAIEEERIVYGGKVVWDKKRIGEKFSLKMMVNILDFKGVELLSVFLHECGHIKDKDDLNIKLESKESELSAWKHAINDFNAISEKEEVDKVLFKDTLKRSLSSYKVLNSEINQILFNII